jgi:hypothetical protein
VRIATLGLPPFTRAPPPISLFPDGHARNTDFEVVELFADVVSMRSTELSPGGPAGPAGPAGPCGPVGPAGNCPAAKSTLSSERFFTLAEVTAFAASLDVVTAERLS